MGIRLTFLVLLCSLITFAQKTDSGNGRIENGYYICNKFDWKIKIPANYSVTDEKLLSEMEQQGTEVIKKDLPNSVAIKKQTHLIAFNLDSKNSFTASFNPLDGLGKFTLEEHKKFALQVINNSFTKIENAKFEVSSSDIKLGDFNFYRIKVEGFTADTHELMLTQVYYNSFIDGNLFNVLISYNYDLQGKFLEKNFIESF